MPITTVQSAMVGVVSTASDNIAFTSDTPIYENTQVIRSSYSITTGSNAMSAGPITIADGVIITVPNGSEWSIV
jgi:acetyltransferase-like isoleucine patch superfamily enzyme